MSNSIKIDALETDVVDSVITAKALLEAKECFTRHVGLIIDSHEVLRKKLDEANKTIDDFQSGNRIRKK